MLKRLLGLSLVIGLAIGIVGCGGSSGSKHPAIYNNIPNIKDTVKPSGNYSLVQKMISGSTAYAEVNDELFTEFSRIVRHHNDWVNGTIFSIAGELQRDCKEEPRYYTFSQWGVPMTISYLDSDRAGYDVKMVASGENPALPHPHCEFVFYLSMNAPKWDLEFVMNAGHVRIIYEEVNGYIHVRSNDTFSLPEEQGQRTTEIYQTPTKEIVRFYNKRYWSSYEITFVGSYLMAPPYNTYGIMTDNLDNTSKSGYFNINDGYVPTADGEVLQGYPEVNDINDPAYVWHDAPEITLQ